MTGAGWPPTFGPMVISVLLRVSPAALREGRLAGRAGLIGSGTEIWVDSAQELIDLLLLQEDPGSGSPRPRPDTDIAVPDEVLVAFALSPRQVEILRHLSQGKSNAEIGAALELSERTVKKHLEHIYGKLGVGSRSAAVARVFGAALAAHGERT